MGLLKSMKQPLKTQEEPKVDSEASKPQEEVVASTDSEQRRGARSWRDVEEGNELNASKQSQSSGAAPSPQMVPAATTERHTASVSPVPKQPSPSSSSQPSNAMEDYKAALQ